MDVWTVCLSVAASVQKMSVRSSGPEERIDLIDSADGPRRRALVPLNLPNEQRRRR